MGVNSMDGDSLCSKDWVTELSQNVMRKFCKAQNAVKKFCNIQLWIFFSIAKNGTKTIAFMVVQSATLFLSPQYMLLTLFGELLWNREWKTFLYISTFLLITVDESSCTLSRSDLAWTKWQNLNSLWVSPLFDWTKKALPIRLGRDLRTMIQPAFILYWSYK